MILSYENMENYVALIINIMDRNMWTVVLVQGILTSESFEKAPNKREMFYFIQAGKLRCTLYNPI